MENTFGGLITITPYGRRFVASLTHKPSIKKHGRTAEEALKELIAYPAAVSVLLSHTRQMSEADAEAQVVLQVIINEGWAIRSGENPSPFMAQMVEKVQELAKDSGIKLKLQYAGSGKEEASVIFYDEKRAILAHLTNDERRQGKASDLHAQGYKQIVNNPNGFFYLKF